MFAARRIPKLCMYVYPVYCVLSVPPQTSSTDGEFGSSHKHQRKQNPESFASLYYNIALSYRCPVVKIMFALGLFTLPIMIRYTHVELFACMFTVSLEVHMWTCRRNENKKKNRMRLRSAPEEWCFVYSNILIAKTLISYIEGLFSIARIYCQ